MTRTPTFLAARLAALDRPEDQPLRDELILDALNDGSPAVREVAVAWAARCIEPATLLPRMADEANSVLRNAALAALERQGPFAVEAVGRMTADPDADMAMFACQVLGGIGSAGAAPALLVALGRPEVNVVQAAIEALGRLRAAEAVPALIELLGREPWLQLAAADALGTIGDRAAIAPLLSLVPDSFVALPALDSIRRIGDPEALPTLLPLLLDPSRAELRLGLTRAIGGILPTAAPSASLQAAGRTIETDHGPNSLWRFLADRLTGAEEEPDTSADPASDDRVMPRGGGVTARAAGCVVLGLGVESLMSLVVRQAADPDWAAWIASVARRFKVPGAGMARALTEHPDPEVRAGALRIIPLEAIGVDRLIVLAADGEGVVRLAALGALGLLQDGAAATTLATRLTTGAAAERLAAAHALAQLPESALTGALAPWLPEGTPEEAVSAALLVLRERRLPDWDERVLRLAGAGMGPLRRAALRAAAQIPGPAAEVVMLRALADREQAVQVEALELLAAHAGDRALRTLVALLAVADSLRYHVIRALGRIGSPDAASALEALFPSAPLHEQLEVLAALERLGNSRSRGLMVECLHHSNPEIRRAAAQGLATLATAEDLDELHRLATSTDWALRTEAARAFGRLGLPEARPCLLDLVRDLEPVVARTARAALGSWP
ncbi:MAG: HEAT repeat domain-containing protein [Gemmatimonadota bacterium]